MTAAVIGAWVVIVFSLGLLVGLITGAAIVSKSHCQDDTSEIPSLEGGEDEF